MTVGDHCECSMTSNPLLKTGVCPLGSQQVMYDYIDAIRKVMETSLTCHTLDRRDFKAQQDCGTAASDVWANAVKQEFNISYWAQVQNEQTATCVRQLMFNSYETLSMSSGEVLKVAATGSLLALLVLM